MTPDSMARHERVGEEMNSKRQRRTYTVATSQPGMGKGSPDIGEVFARGNN
jgi:hypothetical protein